MILVVNAPATRNERIEVDEVVDPVLTPPVVKMLPEPTVARLPLTKSVSCSVNAPKSAIRKGVPDWNVLTPLMDQPSTSLRGQLLNHLKGNS